MLIVFLFVIHQIILLCCCRVARLHISSRCHIPPCLSHMHTYTRFSLLFVVSRSPRTDVHSFSYVFMVVHSFRFFFFCAWFSLPWWSVLGLISEISMFHTHNCNSLPLSPSLLSRVLRYILAFVLLRSLSFFVHYSRLFSIEIRWYMHLLVLLRIRSFEWIGVLLDWVVWSGMWSGRVRWPELVWLKGVTGWGVLL